MTSRQAAQHILDGVMSLFEGEKKLVEALNALGQEEKAKEENIAAETLLMVATGLYSAINEGEYGE